MNSRHDSSFRHLIIAVVFSVLASAALRLSGIGLGPLLALCDFTTTLYLNALSMAVLPLIVFSVLCGAAEFVRQSSSPSLSRALLVTFLGNTFLGVFLAALSFNLIHAIFPVPVSGLAQHFSSVASSAPLAELLLKIFPPNIFSALSSQNMVGIISFSLFWGWALGRIARSQPEHGTRIIQGIQVLSQASLKIVQLFIQVLPYAVAFFILNLGLNFQPSDLQSFSSFLMIFLTAITLYWLAGFLVVWCFLGQRFSSYLSSMKVPLLTAATTTSSAAALPDTITVLEKHYRLPPSLTQFVAPLGTILNMSCSALFICASVFHLAFLHGYTMILSEQISFMLLSWVISWGIAGVPSGSLLSLVILLQVLGIPKESLALILGLDRIFDLFRSLSNVFGNGISALIIAQIAPQEPAD